MSLIDELQHDALDASCGVAHLLRKALVVAKKLDLSEFEAWVRQELTGYDDAKAIPSYRHIEGRVMAQSPYHGWIPFFTRDPEMERILSKKPNGQPVSEMEQLLQESEGDLIAPIDGSVQEMLLRGQEESLPLAFHIDPSRLRGVLDQVRTVVLDWTLRLQKEGIVGSGTTFSFEERSKATASPRITNFITNHIGSIAASAVQQGTSQSTQCVTAQTLDLDELRRLLPELEAKLRCADLGEEEDEALEADLQVLAAALSARRPNKVVIREALSSIREVLEGAGAAILGRALWERFIGMAAT